MGEGSWCLCEAVGLLLGEPPALRQRGRPGPGPDSTFDGLWTLCIPLPSPGLSFPFCEVHSESLAPTDRQLPQLSDDFLGLPADPRWGHRAAAAGLLGGWGEAGKRYFPGFPGVRSAPRGGPLTPVLSSGPWGAGPPISEGRELGVRSALGCARLQEPAAGFCTHEVPLTPQPGKALCQIGLRAGEAQRARQEL